MVFTVNEDGSSHSLLELLSAATMGEWLDGAGDTLFNPRPTPPSSHNITKQYVETAYAPWGFLKLEIQTENSVSVPEVKRSACWALGALARQIQCPEVSSIYWLGKTSEGWRTSCQRIKHVFFAQMQQTRVTNRSIMSASWDI